MNHRSHGLAKGSKLLMILLMSWLVSCGQGSDQSKAELKTYIVQEKPMHKTLFFTGTIQPIQASALISPVDAVIETIHHHYGEVVKKGDVILTLNSSELQKQYQEALTEYLKSKDSFTIAKTKFTGTQELWEAGLLSKNNYLSEKSNLNTIQMTLMQAKRKLSDLLEKMDDGTVPNLSRLKMAELDRVQQALAVNHQLIRLKALQDGLLLYPPQSNDDKMSRLSVGLAVKLGQVLALVGDVSGICVEIEIPEVDVSQIHPGLAATITGIALNQSPLKGKVIAVNAQATQAHGSPLPTFSAIVQVAALTENDRDWIKIGMTASIAITTETTKQLMIPIAAIQSEKGKSLVQVRGADGSLSPRVISTGPAQADQVVVLSGIKPGECIAYG